MSGSWCGNYVRLGTLVIFVHDTADFWLEVTLLSGLYYLFSPCPEFSGCWDFGFGVSDILVFWPRVLCDPFLSPQGHSFADL